MSHCNCCHVGGTGHAGGRRDLGSKVLTIGASIGLLCSILVVGPTRAADNTDARSSLYVQVPRPVDRIPPGLTISNAPPEGWTHLIVKSQPRLAPGESKKVFPVVAKNATLLFTAILANVAEDQRNSGFFLDQLALGFGTRINGQDTIVSSASAKQQGANLGVVGGVILSQSEQRLDKFLLVARSPTMALLDIPGIVLFEDKHRDLLMRYAVLVDKQSGKLDTLLWLLDPASAEGYRLASGAMRRLHPNLIEDCKLHVDTADFTAGIPGQRAFAVYGAPPGQNGSIPERLMPLLERKTLEVEWLPQLERELRTVAFTGAPP